MEGAVAWHLAECPGPAALPPHRASLGRPIYHPGRRPEIDTERFARAGGRAQKEAGSGPCVCARSVPFAPALEPAPSPRRRPPKHTHTLFACTHDAAARRFGPGRANPNALVPRAQRPRTRLPR